MSDYYRSYAHQILVGFAVTCLLGACTAVEQQSAGRVLAQRPVSEPYTGNLDIFEWPGRAEALQIERVMDELRITSGKTVADIGAGSGWFTVLAARRVGAGGKVYAVDINQGYVDYIEKRSRREGLNAIQPLLGTANDPKLPTTAVDAVLMLRAYHEVAEPVALLKQTRQALKPEGLLGIIDRNGRGNDHGIEQKVVVEEAARAGFKLVKSFDFVKAGREDYFLVFQLASKT